MKMTVYLLLLAGLVGIPVVEAAGLFQKIEARKGVLYFEDGREVNLFGVNFQPCISFEHGSRMHNQGLLMPLKVKDLKQVADESFDQIQRLGSELIRVHLTPADFTDAQGNLVETIWLDMLDYTLAGASNRGLYIYLTFLNHLINDGTQFPFNRQSFAASFEREEWMVDPAAVAATKNCIRQLLNRRNPYNGLLYKDHDALAVVEPVNEPAYYWFEKWKETNEGGTREQFENWSYENTLGYINALVELFRNEGLTQPVVWNCGWTGLITKHRSAYRAVADSKVDAISFCLYPGQSDLKKPFWENPEELSDRNYLPYIQHCSDDEDGLGWLRSEAFAGKAKLVYEFETFCNQSGYLYPAMAKFFRSAGAQIAAQWTYGLSGSAEYLGGSHVLNLKTTPRKAASFMVAKQVFKTLPRLEPYSTKTTDGDAFDSFALSASSGSSWGLKDHALIYSGWNTDEVADEGTPPETIIGLGTSPYVDYAGSGLYFIEPSENDALRVTIEPDVEWLRPHWKECHTGDQVVKLICDVSHPFKLKLPGTEAPRWIYRKEGYRWQLVAAPKDAVQFEAMPGEYLIEKQQMRIDRKVLEEGWGN
ncbi:glycoside hydrolase 5 family protein [Pontiella sulfatireligans]|uniref:Glycoside hydrolase family 5 domain-containing protein n=1 Tax=Pontiella sulfatireligans TaxID=2750658 RepID=A0A6C2UFQ5_9BACT|nr:hypothetical protein [Pontiella sulfatireligans]VGO19000.1 hypothetical protein SCARR_01054 [Pontiella sulfatireligans]